MRLSECVDEILVVRPMQYRSALSFTEDSFVAAKNSLARVDRAISQLQSLLPQEPGMDNAIGRDAEVRAVCEKALSQFEDAMCNDMNTPRATSALFRLVSAAEKLYAQAHAAKSSGTGGTHTTGVGAGVERAARCIFDAIRKMDEVFGVLYTVPESYIATDSTGGTIVSETHRQQAEALGEQRMRLKAERRFEEADRLRDDIRGLGFDVRDTAAGFELSPIS